MTADTLPRGALVGRYTVLGLLGRGGMGEVYAAYDSQLDRRVALKLLRQQGGDGNERAEARLLREARAIAQLSHRNVIAVHDVGTFGARVFVAMEHVAGQTLSAWLAAKSRGPDEILAVFLQAANGLAAAHAAGLVHRDFKPQNVMVARDGTVRVTDFGLARRVENSDDGGDSASIGLQAAARADLSLTETGELIGTPLYMSPEQFRRVPTDARTDQFSFCVALYEALYGEHPFSGTGGIAELMTAVLTGRVRATPERRGVPPRLRRIVLRGLAVAPDARWPAMTDLAAAITRAAATNRRRLAGIVALGIVLAGSAAIAGRASRSGPRPLCRVTPSRLADVWAPRSDGSKIADRRRATLAAAFAASGAPDGADVWSRTERLLDRYSADWLAMHQDACEATHMRGEQSEQVLDLRMGCLEQRRQSLEALVDVLSAADADAVRSAADAVTRLPDLSLCANVEVLRSAAPPRSPSLQARIDDLRRRAEQAKALHDVGRRRIGIEQLQALTAEARTLGDQQVLAELLTLLATVFVNGEYAEDFSPTIEEAAWTALRARRDDLAAQCASILTAYVGIYQNRPAEGRRWANLAQALLDRMGGGNERIRAWVLQGLADIAEQDDSNEALRLTRQALVLKRRVLPPDHPDIAFSMETEAEDMYRIGDASGAVLIAEQAERILVASYGPNSPLVAQQESNRAEYLLAVGRTDEALALFRTALRVWEEGMGSDYRYLAYPLTGIGRALLALGRPREAEPTLERALRIRERDEKRPIELAETHFALAQSLWGTGDRRRALDFATRARDEYSRARSAHLRLREVQVWLAAHDGAASRRGARPPGIAGLRPLWESHSSAR